LVRKRTDVKMDIADLLAGGVAMICGNYGE